MAESPKNIALGLDSNLTRVAELVNGERFTPETAFHMEMTLGLPDGFFDQPNPVPTPEIIARLKSPLNHIHANADLDHAYEGVDNAAVANQTAAHTSPIDGLPEEAEMPKKTSSGAAPAAAGEIGVEAQYERLPESNVSFALQRPDSLASTPSSFAQDAYPSTTATNLDILRGISPIAEALLKTLAGKARTGRLDEIKALQLLQQAILL